MWHVAVVAVRFVVGLVLVGERVRALREDMDRLGWSVERNSLACLSLADRLDAIERKNGVPSRGD